jgi:hypothetical protein
MPEPSDPSQFDSLYYFKGRYIYIIFILSGVRLNPLGTAATADLLYQPQKIDDGDYGAIGGMKIGRENRSTRKETCLSATLSTTNST